MSHEAIIEWYSSGWIFVLLAFFFVYEMYDNWKAIHRGWFVFFCFYAFMPIVINLAFMTATK